MPQANDLGMNRTGMDMSPIQGKAMIQGTRLATVGPMQYDEMETIRRAYIKADGKVGSVPLPASLQGAVTTGKEKFKGRHPEVLINKLGERLAFERTGVRLYEALIFKCQATPDKRILDVVSTDTLRQFRNEEEEHFFLIKEIIEDLGADPTAMTPDADVCALASLGIPKVLTEPRTTITQCLQAILTAELSDNAGWGLLQELAEGMGQDQLAKKCRHAHSQEQIHAETVTQWLRDLTLHAGGKYEQVRH